jgi:hypothetical protein
MAKNAGEVRRGKRASLVGRNPDPPASETQTGPFRNVGALIFFSYDIYHFTIFGIFRKTNSVFRMACKKKFAMQFFQSFFGHIHLPEFWNFPVVLAVFRSCSKVKTRQFNLLGFNSPPFRAVEFSSK